MPICRCQDVAVNMPLIDNIAPAVMQAIAEMGIIKAQGDREQAMSEAEWKQLSNLIENDRRERVSLL